MATEHDLYISNHAQNVRALLWRGSRSCRWTVSGFKEAMEVPNNFKDLRKLGVRNIAQYSAANVSFPAFLFFTATFTSSMPPAMFTGRETKPRLGAVFVHSHDCKTHLLKTTQTTWPVTATSRRTYLSYPACFARKFCKPDCLARVFTRKHLDFAWRRSITRRSWCI